MSLLIGRMATANNILIRSSINSHMSVTNKIKIVFVGDSGVGKTALFQRLDNDVFADDYVSTIGGSYAKVVTEAYGHKFELGFWDTAGQEKFRNIVPMYFQHASFILATFDVTAPDSFHSITEWINLAKEKGPSNAIIIIVANKIDLEPKVTFGEIEELAAALNVEYVIQTSAKSGIGIDTLLTQITTLLKKVSLLNEVNEEPQINKVDTVQKDSSCC